MVSSVRECGGRCDGVHVEEMIWHLGEIEINLQKMKKASTWECAIKGHGELNEFDRQKEQKKMTLERFQEEHPGELSIEIYSRNTHHVMLCNRYRL